MSLSSCRIRVAAVAAILAASGLGGCVVVPAESYGYADGPTVAVAPPAPQVEVVGVAPGPGYFWVGGWWLWNGGRYVWRPGYWETHRPGYRWVPHEWHRGPGGWQARPGHWHR